MVKKGDRYLDRNTGISYRVQSEYSDDHSYCICLCWDSVEGKEYKKPYNIAVPYKDFKKMEKLEDK